MSTSEFSSSELLQPAPPPLRDAAWVAEHLFDGAVSVHTVWRHARLRRIPHLRLGDRVYFDEGALRAALRAQALALIAPKRRRERRAR